MRLTVNSFSLFLVLFFLFLNLQTLAITGWMIEEESSLKFYHLFSLLFLPCLLLRASYKVPKVPSYIFDYFVGITVISLLLFLFYPFNRILINHLFAFYAFYIGYYIAGVVSGEQIIALLQKVTMVIFAAIAVKLLFHIPEITRFFKAPYGHPAVYTIYGGGTNLEATWLSLNAALFINRKKAFYIMLSIALAISIIYASRVGVVIGVLVAGFKFISGTTSRQERKAILVFFFLVLLSFIFFIDFEELATKVYALKRFTEFGGDADHGMGGRFAMWRYYGTALWNSNLLGYGAGNGMYAIKLISRDSYLEDNLHNLYMQVLIEFGFIGLFLYMLTVYNISVKAFKSRLVNPLAIIILTYYIASLVQFRGTDAIIWLYIGLFLRFEANKTLALNE